MLYKAIFLALEQIKINTNEEKSLNTTENPYYSTKKRVDEERWKH